MFCRMCKSENLKQFLDLGFAPPSDQFLRKEQMHEPILTYPLEVMLCMQCGLVQLSFVVSPEVLYRNDYPYESSVTKTGRLHWAEFALTTAKQLELDKNDLVVDIGSNVGVLLEEFRNNGTQILGVDPASNIALIALKRGIETINEFFDIDVANNIVKNYGHAKVITGTNVFAHIDDLDAFMYAVDVLLSDSGVFIFEAPYFVNMIKNLEYDTIYHEHLSYLSVKPIISFFRRFGMEIIDIQQRDIHGGSFRVWVVREGKMPVSPIVGELLLKEKEMGIHEIETLNKFADAVQQNRQELLWLLRKLKHDGKRIVGVSAPAKGMTLLNYSRIGTETLDFVSEKSTLKIGRFTPGTHIPVVSDDELIKQAPDFALLLAWNFAEEIMENLKTFRENGGRFIIPIPNPRVID